MATEKRWEPLDARFTEKAGESGMADGESAAVERVVSRRTRSAAGARPHRTVIRHSDEEWARVAAAARHLGLSVPGFYERAAFAGSAQAAVELSIIEDELCGVRRLLANAANNLNQVARGVNSDGVVDEVTLQGSLLLFSKTIARLNVLLDGLPGRGMQ